MEVRGSFSPSTAAQSGPFLPALSPAPAPHEVSVPGPAAGREPSTPAEGGGDARVPPRTPRCASQAQLALGILHALLYAARLCLPAAGCLHRLYRERRLSYRASVSSRLWAALRTTLSAASLLAQRLLCRPPSPALLPPLAILLPLSPVLHALSPQPHLAEVGGRTGTRAGRESGAAAFPRAEDQWRVEGGVRTGRKRIRAVRETEARLECAPGFWP